MNRNIADLMVEYHLAQNETEAQTLINSGKVKIDGEVVTQIDFATDKTDFLIEVGKSKKLALTFND